MVRIKKKVCPVHTCGGGLTCQPECAY